ncbi:unnamed protein product [Nippostrongylus brasiliensis]|uniref:Vegetative cell wall protein gp1-like n=1 Tax=Nippostrongylus brasiliensis TaxID=27835 RepID=A0A0N4YZW2_NIPBR|nr:unnamed protein product [Nippostrongylus brasiliensis]
MPGCCSESTGDNILVSQDQCPVVPVSNDENLCPSPSAPVPPGPTRSATKCQSFSVSFVSATSPARVRMSPVTVVPPAPPPPPSGLLRKVSVPPPDPAAYINEPPSPSTIVECSPSHLDYMSPLFCFRGTRLYDFEVVLEGL